MIAHKVLLTVWTSGHGHTAQLCDVECEVDNGIVTERGRRVIVNIEVDDMEVDEINIMDLIRKWNKQD